MKRDDCPTVTAEVTFLTANEGGRRTAPVLTPQYRPHIVVQSPSIRHAVADDDAINREPYLGICFLDAPSDFRLGHSAAVILELMYHPRVDYSEIRPGATFPIREGGRVVGHGRVISRDESRADTR